jgi:transposase InsO family protein
MTGIIGYVSPGSSRKGEGHMTENELYQERALAIHLRRSEIPVLEIAAKLNRSRNWVYYWWHRYEDEGWEGLHSKSRAPEHSPQQVPEHIQQRIRRIRSELEFAAETQDELSYIGAPTIRAQLIEEGIASPPGTATIERVLSAAGMTHPYQQQTEEVHYPRLQPDEPGQLCQVDIVPHYLHGGEAVACFNAIDVVSSYPTGQAYAQRRSLDAQRFLIHVWQALGIPQYTQVDNEGCFSGGFTHEGVLGRVLRLALYVGTELLFSPVRHPESNGTIERFHQDYNQYVWEDTDLADCAAVQARGDRFFQLYRHSRHIRGLQGQSPAEVHHPHARCQLSTSFEVPSGKLPLTTGRVHFMRRVHAHRSIKLLNLTWTLPEESVKPKMGVWATLEFQEDDVLLEVYDAAPDAAEREPLAEYPFPVKEDVHPLRTEFEPAAERELWEELFTPRTSDPVPVCTML